MKFSMVFNHFFKETCIDRPDLSTLACVNAECQHYGQSGRGNLGLRKVYGRDRIPMDETAAKLVVGSKESGDSLLLYDSYARGDYDVTSDIDILRIALAPS